MDKLYKILVDGRSCHGGDLKWSLPTKKGNKWIPGEWHEVKGDLKICERGLHLTKKPLCGTGWDAKLRSRGRGYNFVGW
ncbi:MAG: hypothetical protein IPM48_14680 [Saprospiraceae bacterium]|nr:hypothetical protein [Saprospiraceae bacterium]